MVIFNLLRGVHMLLTVQQRSLESQANGEKRRYFPNILSPMVGPQFANNDETSAHLTHLTLQLWN